MFARGDRVQLTVDVYARQFPSLTRGAVGTVFSVARRGQDHLLHVIFPGAGRRAIPAAYLAPAGVPAGAGDQAPPEAAAPAGEAAEAAAASPAVLVIGPRGGYRSLTYRRDGEIVTVTRREAILSALEQLRREGVPVVEEQAS